MHLVFELHFICSGSNPRRSNPAHLPASCLLAARDLIPLLSTGAYEANESGLSEALLQGNAAYLALRRLVLSHLTVGRAGAAAGGRAKSGCVMTWQ